MTRRQNPPLPETHFGLLLVEGGDERAVSQVLAANAWSQLCCWKAEGRSDLPGLAALAKLDPNFGAARSVGIVLDIESSLSSTQALVTETLKVLGASGSFVHGVLHGVPRLGAFLVPDGVGPGSIETLCREAAKDRILAACVDQLVSCAGSPHRAHGNPRAAEDKGWLKAYLGMTSEPDLRFHQAFVHPQGIDASHPAFGPLRAFLLAL
jgi:hypothetical protein